MVKVKMHTPIDAEWDRLQHMLPETFTTQMFRDVIVREMPKYWGDLVEKYGSGGKASGNYYSPNNVLYNCLRDKVAGGVLVNMGSLPPEKGWGTSQVQCFRKVSSDITFEPMEGVAISSEEDRSFVEGEPKRVTHLARERAAGLRSAVIQKRSEEGLSCDVCGDTGGNLPSDLREAMFEAHHATEPLSTGIRKTNLSDMALLCACCHRLLHRLVSVRNQWVTVAEAKAHFGEGR